MIVGSGTVYIFVAGKAWLSSKTIPPASTGEPLMLVSSTQSPFSSPLVSISLKRIASWPVGAVLLRLLVATVVAPSASVTVSPLGSKLRPASMTRVPLAGTVVPAGMVYVSEPAKWLITQPETSAALSAESARVTVPAAESIAEIVTVLSAGLPNWFGNPGVGVEVSCQPAPPSGSRPTDLSVGGAGTVEELPAGVTPSSEPKTRRASSLPFGKTSAALSPFLPSPKSVLSLPHRSPALPTVHQSYVCRSMLGSPSGPPPCRVSGSRKVPVGSTSICVAVSSESHQPDRSIVAGPVLSTSIQSAAGSKLDSSAITSLTWMWLWRSAVTSAALGHALAAPGVAGSSSTSHAPVELSHRFQEFAFDALAAFL